MKAIGDNAVINFNGDTVTQELRPTAIAPFDYPSVIWYPITTVLGMEISEPSKSGGTFRLVVDLSDPDTFQPITVDYSEFGVKAFWRLVEETDEALRYLQRPFYPGGRPVYPGSYAFIPQQATMTAPATDVSVQLARLAQLRDQGALTDAEFAAAKAQLLGI